MGWTSRAWRVRIARGRGLGAMALALMLGGPLAAQPLDTAERDRLLGYFVELFKPSEPPDPDDGSIDFQDAILHFDEVIREHVRGRIVTTVCGRVLPRSVQVRGDPPYQFAASLSGSDVLMGTIIEGDVRVDC